MGPTAALPGHVDFRHPVLGDVVIRLWSPEDADALAEAIASSLGSLRDWMPWAGAEPISSDERLDLIRLWRREWEVGGDAVYGIFVTGPGDEGGRVAGGTGLHWRHGPDVLEIGYWIAEGFRERGLATAVARELTRAALQIPAITAVRIAVDTSNDVSARVPSRLGFKEVGRVAGEPKARRDSGVLVVWESPGSGILEP